MPPFVAMIPAIAQGLGGLAQTIFGGGRARRAEKALEKLQTPVYQQNKGIGDYYTKALNRYATDPTKSSLYTQQMRNIERGTATGMSALNDRRTSSVSGLVQAQNDASLNALSAAEQQQAQALQQLGQATQLKADDERMAFQYNQVAPFQKKMALLGQKAAGGAATMNAGIQNMFGAASSIGSMLSDDYMTQKYFGGK